MNTIPCSNFRHFLYKTAIGRCTARAIALFLSTQIALVGQLPIPASSAPGWLEQTVTRTMRGVIITTAEVELNFARNALEPGAPATALTFEPKFEVAARSKGNKVQLLWLPVPKVSRYDIFRAADTDPVVFDFLATTTASTSLFLDSSAAAEKTHLYVVRALTLEGDCFSQVISSHPSFQRTLVNHPPVIYSPPVLEAVPGEAYHYNVNATDPDLNPIAYALTNHPPGMVIDPTSGAIDWLPLAAGDYPVSVDASDAGGLIDRQNFQVSVRERNDPPVADAGLDQSARVGATVTLDGTRSADPDGDPLAFTWSLVSRPTGSAATLSNPTAINPAFQLDWPGTYVAELVVNDGTVDSAPDTVTITTENSPPVAEAGADRFALVGTTVTLDGTRSSDSDGDTLSFSWALVVKPDGSTATLSDPTSLTPTFRVDLPGDYVAQLVVNDGQSDSVPDTMTVSTLNSAPVANAGPDQRALVGTVVRLDGSSSSDVDGNSLGFAWSLVSRPPGSTATLDDPTAVQPNFQIDQPGSYLIQLIVNDGSLDSAPDTVVIATDNTPPLAEAGPDQLARVGTTATLDGSRSSDTDGDSLGFLWSLITRPAGSIAALNDPSAVNPILPIDRPGTYVVQLVVNDGTVNSPPDTVIISTENSPPVANAGPDQTAPVGTAVTLDAGASSDADGDLLAFFWALTSTPAGSTATLDNPTSARPRFVLDRPGSYVAQLIANDGLVDGAPDTVTLSTVNSPPIANAGVDQTVRAGDSVVLDATNSSDVDGDVLSFAWSLTTVPPGSTATLNDPQATKPVFVADLPGTYVAQLIVDDGAVASVPDAVVVTTVNTPPVANAGPDKTVDIGSTVLLDGSGSGDVDGDPLTFSWSLLSVPNGSAATLDNPLIMAPAFVADRAGTYIIQLITNDGLAESAPDTVIITTANSRPVANAGPDQTVERGATVLLDGRASTDADNTPLDYRWSLTTRPPASMATLNNPNASTPSFVADLEGIYVAQLIVTDGQLESAPDTVTIQSAIPLAAVPNVVGLSQSVAENAITAAGLAIGTLTTANSSSVPAGHVIGQNPNGGTQVPEGSSVDLVISLGPPAVIVPNVVGLAQNAAQQTLLNAGLLVGLTSTAHSQTVPAGSVISQNPLAGETVAPDSTVNLVISSGPLTIAVPDLVGLPQSAAELALTAAGLTVGTLTTAPSQSVPAGAVISQSPASGTQVPPETSVDLILSLGPPLDDEPPLLSASLDAPLYQRGSPASLTITATDNSATVDAVYILDGAPPQPASLPLTLIDTTPMSPGSSHTLTVVVTDPASNTASRTLVFGIIDPNDSAGPVVALTSPSTGAVLSATTEIIGTASDPNLIEYTLEYAPQGTDQFVTFASGTQSVVAASLGSFDPSMVRDGTYQIRLTALDAGGRSASLSRYVEVARGAKLGQFSTSFTDEMLTFGAFPLSVMRNYDSRDRSVPGEFGYGWSLDLSKATATQNAVLGTNWQETRSGGFFPSYTVSPTAPHTITIKLSEDHEAKFEMGVNPATQQLIPIDFTDAIFTRVGGEGSLQANSTGLFILDAVPGPVTLIDDSTFEPYNPDALTYTDLDGFQYRFNRTSSVRFALASITDPSGTTLQLTPTGLIRSDGIGLQFTRDAQGRITQCFDPNGNITQYTYDSRGDLVEVTDPAGHKTRFVYDSDHFLIKIIDPLNRVAQRQEYDEDGRLIAITDANGVRVAMEYDLANNTHIVRDRRGNPTLYRYDAAGNVIEQTDLPEVDGVPTPVTRTFAYDANGNVVQETDGKGNTWSSSFDARGNLLSRTDPLGRTERFTYDANNKVLTHTDRRGNVSTNVYDSSGRLVRRTDREGHSTTFTYDSRGNLLSETDALQNTTTYAYDGTGKKIRATDPLGRVTTFTYDANGNKLTETITIGGVAATTTFVYNSRDLLVATIDPLGNAVRTEWDAAGHEVAKIDGAGHRTETLFDSRGKITAIKYPDGSSTETSFDADGNKASITNRNGEVSTFTYDALDQLTRVTRPDGSTQRMYYDAAGKTIRESDERGFSTTHEYNAVGLRRATTQPGNAITQYTYDANGNRTAVTDANGHTTQFAFDALDRLILTTHPDGSTASTTYDAAGRVVATTDPMGHVTRFAYDPVGNLLRVTDALGGVTQYTYDEANRRLSQTDANGNTTTFEYDLAGNQVRRTLPGGQSERFVHDANGRTIRHIDFAGETHVFGYDEVGRQTLASYADGTVITTTYTGEGAPLQVTDPRGLTTHAYDNRGRLVSKNDPATGIVSYTYDAAGNQLTVTSPSGATTTHSYDPLNRLASSTDSSAGVTSYTYDAVGNLKQVDNPNGTRARYTYNNRNQLTRLENLRGDGSPISSFNYTLNANGLRMNIEELGAGNVAYTYDALNRVLSEVRTGANSYSDAFSYDPAGNRLTRTHNGQLTTSVYDANDRLLSDGAGTSFSYDSKGNLIGKTDASGTTVHRYDSLNRLIGSTSPSGVIVNYDYDAFGNRRAIRDGLGTVSSQYVVDTRNSTGNSQVIEERDGTGSVRARFAYGLDLISQDRGGSRSYYHYDGLGSTRQLTNSVGNVTDTYVYDAFGNGIASSGSTQNPYRFTGEELDPALGYYFLRARYYSPEQGRFIGMDPAEGDPQSPVSLHRYLYANDNPVNYIDPSGRFTLVSVSISISIDMNIRSIYTQNLVKFFFKAARIAYCTIEPGYKLRELGFEMIASDIPGGEMMVTLGQQIIAAGYRAIGSEIVETYRNIASDIVQVEVEVRGFLNDLIEAAQNGWTIVPVPEEIEKLIDLKEQLESYLAEFAQLLDDGDRLLNGTNCERFTVLANRADQIAGLIPSF